jgi:Mn-dependent DtxR family transcriptional regulator
VIKKETFINKPRYGYRMATKRDLDILRYMYAVGGVEFRDLMIKFCLKPPILSRSLSRLINEGYVRKVCRGFYEITEKGKEFVEGGLEEKKESRLFLPRR